MVSCEACAPGPEGGRHLACAPHDLLFVSAGKESSHEELILLYWHSEGRGKKKY